MTPNREAPRTLCEEILAEARQQAEQLLGRARQEAEALLAKAKAEAQAARAQRLDLAQAQAVHSRALLESTLPIQVNRMRAARIEALLHEVHEAVCQRLLAREGFDYRETLLTLGAEAISRMRGNAFVVKLSPADHSALGDGLGAALAQRASRGAGLSLRLTDDPTLTQGGLVVEDSEGRQVWDNRLLARLERLWPELRRGLAAGLSLVANERTAGGDA